MKKQKLTVDPSISLRISLDNPNRVEIVDNFVLTTEIVSTVLTPYITSLYESLALRAGGNLPDGVPKHIISEVFLFFYAGES